MPTVHIDRLLETALRAGATDLLFVPGRPPTLRIDGRERSLEATVLTDSHVLTLIKAVIPEPRLQELEQIGRTTVAFAFGDKGRVRASASRHAAGHALSLRMHPAKLRTIEECGLPPIVKALCRRPRGLFLVAGPSGSGRTTLLAALIDYINRTFDYRIVTLERAIEIVHTHSKSALIQRELGTHAPTYAAALRELHLDAADAVLLGEIEDAATITAALEAARADCLVLGAIRARGAAQVVSRLCNAVVATQPADARTLVSEGLLAVLCIVLCPRFQASGLVPAFEFLVTTPAVANLIREGKLEKLDEAMRAGGKYGMRLLDDHLFELVRERVISAEEALDQARQPADFQARIDRLERGQSDDSAGGPLSDPVPVRPDRPPPDLSGHAESS